MKELSGEISPGLAEAIKLLDQRFNGGKNYYGENDYHY